MSVRSIEWKRDASITPTDRDRVYAPDSRLLLVGEIEKLKDGTTRVHRLRKLDVRQVLVVIEQARQYERVLDMPRERQARVRERCLVDVGAVGIAEFPEGADASLQAQVREVLTVHLWWIVAQIDLATEYPTRRDAIEALLSAHQHAYRLFVGTELLRVPDQDRLWAVEALRERIDVLNGALCELKAEELDARLATVREAVANGADRHEELAQLEYARKRVFAPVDTGLRVSAAVRLDTARENEYERWAAGSPEQFTQWRVERTRKQIGNAKPLPNYFTMNQSVRWLEGEAVVAGKVMRARGQRLRLVSEGGRRYDYTIEQFRALVVG